MNVSEFIQTHYQHFNAATLSEAADSYVSHLQDGGRMLMTLAGAMSTAELGLSLAEMIRQDKVHAICCTGANLEEDLFNLVAHQHYQRIPDWRNLTAERERELHQQGLNRVTDTCIPEEQAFRAIERTILELWRHADQTEQSSLPHEFFYELIREGLVEKSYQIDPAHSWLVAACEKDLPLFVPGWEDSTLGNVFVSRVLRGDLRSFRIIRSGLEYMAQLADWYLRTTTGQGVSASIHQQQSVPKDQISSNQPSAKVGFFQIGGGIAGDFPICAVPMLHQDLGIPCPYWGYFCQISDSTTSYGSYSGAIPTEKITWGKLDVDTPQFIIESDASIVAPLMFARILGW